MRSLLRIRGNGNLFLSFLLLVFLTMYGCGGGGGDGGSTGGGTTGGTTYTGVTSQATIDQTSAAAIAKVAYTGGEVGGTVGSFGAVVQETEIDQPTYLYLTQAIKEAIHQIDVHAPQGVVGTGTIVSQSSVINGTCGGNASYTIQVDDTTGQFSGNMTFNNYCSGGVTMSGAVAFSGTINSSTGISNFTLTFTNLTATKGSTSITLDGSIAYTFQSSGFTATMDMRQRNNATGKVYWINNYSMSATVTSSYVQFGVSGRFYDPDYGYVDISTPTPFRISSGQSWPSQGVMIVTGKNGTKARLTVTSGTTYVVDVDADGNGSYEWTSGTLTWQ